MPEKIRCSVCGVEWPSDRMTEVDGMVCPICYEEFYDDRRYDIVAFRVPRHKSLLYRRFRTLSQLLRDVEEACQRGANVISIRLVKKEGDLGDGC